MPFIVILWRVDVASGTGLAAIAQPGLHRGDLVALADDDALAEDRDVLARAVRRRPAGHDHGLSVMRNHARHEFDVGVAVGQPPEPGRRGMQAGTAGALAQPPPTAAASRHIVIVGRQLLLIALYRT